MRLKLRVRPYDLEMLGERSREISYGELAHRALYFLKPLPSGYGRREVQKAISEAVKRAISLGDSRLREDLAEAERFLRKILVKALLLEEVRPFFVEGVKFYNEIEVQDAAGDLHRLDRLVFLNDKPVILEYKLGGRRRAHLDQVKCYQKILKEIFGSEPQAYLFYLEEPALVDIKHIKQKPLW